MKLPQMIRNLWIYRRVIALAVLLGVIGGFVWANKDPLEVRFPLLGKIQSSAGVVMLVSVALGAAGTWLVMMIRRTLQSAHEARGEPAHRVAPDPPPSPPATEPPRETTDDNPVPDQTPH
jgi:uncharacterized integral membrane protein